MNMSVVSLGYSASRLDGRVDISETGRFGLRCLDIQSLDLLSMFIVQPPSCLDGDCNLNAGWEIGRLEVHNFPSLVSKSNPASTLSKCSLMVICILSLKADVTSPLVLYFYSPYVAQMECISVDTIAFSMFEGSLEANQSGIVHMEA